MSKEVLRVSMLTESQTRILRLLTRYPEEIENAWDVPRELSLPGLAESLGLVRSALHEPLKLLENSGLIRTRQAHVIGGGSRRRNVIHITSKGRQQVTMTVESAEETNDYTKTNNGVFGRNVELLNLQNELENGFAIVTGIPGIGKTALLKELKNSRYCALDSSMDVTNLIAKWLGIDDAPQNLEAQIAMLVKINKILIADNLQSVHERHQSKINELLSRLMDSDKIKLAIGVRAPSPYEATLKLEGIQSEYGYFLLGDSVTEERAIEVTKALDGHPLALHLWEPTDELPEASEAVQSFVEGTVLSRISSSQKSDLDTLCSEPRPIDAMLLDSLDIDALDDAALLRWPDGRVEVQHLVRNVRRVSWDDPKKIHADAAKRWSSVDGNDARWFEAYHLTMAGVDSSQFIKEHSESIMSNGSSSTATLLADVLHHLPEAHELRRMAAQVALDRGEINFAKEHLNSLPKPDYELLARLHRTNGELKKAHEAYLIALENSSPVAATQMRISRLAAKLDDRLPDEKGVPDGISKDLSNIDIGSLEKEKRKAAVVLLAMIRHRICIQNMDSGGAQLIRDELSNLTNSNDPLIERLEHVSNLRLSNESGSDILAAEAAMRRLVERTADPIHRVSLGLALVQAQAQTNPLGAATTLERLLDVPLPLDVASGRRLDAMRWFWQGELDTDSRLSYWTEAAHRLRTAECPNAAKSLTVRLHRAL
ncbi:MAG: hypothetical protein QF440_00510 [Candidatus Thalassarchaeaceae archaeon]|jgi:DNA-binding MarR family transcriptional regulator|nr:hypothetical protein [Candidatus Thalassarchaeaceae archaeon]